MPNFVSIKQPSVILESFKDFAQFSVLDPCHNAPKLCKFSAVYRIKFILIRI